MIVRVGFLDKDENYIARLANYYSAHANETVQFEIYLFTKEEALRKQLSRGGRMDLLVAEEDLLPEPEEYSRNMELAFWSTEKHEQKTKRISGGLPLPEGQRDLPGISEHGGKTRPWSIEL